MSRFRVTSKDRQITILDLKTGEDITRLAKRVTFSAEAGEGFCLEITLQDFDPEIEVESPEEITVDPSRSAVSDGDLLGAPPIMITSKRNLPMRALEHLRESLKLATSERKPFVVDGGLKVYQLLEGRWRPL